ncbi:MAG: sialate O-acetylesterase [bacterium]|nr:sialate O-acetylesterase [bacterium]
MFIRQIKKMKKLRYKVAVLMLALAGQCAGNYVNSAGAAVDCPAPNKAIVNEKSTRTTIDLVVLAGQSNMQGWQGNAAKYPEDPEGLDGKIRFYWVTPGYSSSQGKWTSLQPQGGLFPQGHFGPEVSLARNLARSGKNLAVFKYSLGSTSLATEWKGPGEKGMYDSMTVALDSAVKSLQDQGFEVVFKAFFWVQGESDAKNQELAEGYGDCLKKLLDDFRTRVAGNSSLPVILGVDEQHLWVKQFPQVVEAQKKLAQDGRNIAFTSMIGLEKADSTHLTPKGLVEHGDRLFAACKALTAK